jgi:hypothetical protein
MTLKKRDNMIGGKKKEQTIEIEGIRKWGGRSRHIGINF